MDLIHACCAGLDVHNKTVVACVRRVAPDGRVEREVRTYRTMTADRIALADWLDARGVSHVAIESTGVYWKPVFHLMEGRFEVLLANAHRIKTRTSRGGRPTSRTASGSPSSSSSACSRPASSRPPRSARCAT